MPVPSRLPPWARPLAARMGLVRQLAALDEEALQRAAEAEPQQTLPPTTSRPWIPDPDYFEPAHGLALQPAEPYPSKDPFALASKEALRASLAALARQSAAAPRPRAQPAPRTRPAPRFVSERDLGPVARPLEPTARFVSAADLERDINPPLTPAIDPPGALLLDATGRTVDAKTGAQVGIDEVLLRNPRYFMPSADEGEEGEQEGLYGEDLDDLYAP